ncbi:unnamed protein product [Linum tenue]|uniref:Uncharacterized protein n=1 Tax=Linum tenue TaxID=586396 RepID=A0AAV0JC45_9ROSI|nr:unnamed protein product [Linum tenue]
MMLESKQLELSRHLNEISHRNDQVKKSVTYCQACQDLYDFGL